MATNYLTAEELSKVLKVGVDTVRRWAEEEKIPAIKFPGDGKGCRWRFDEERVVTHLSTGYTDSWARQGSQGVSKARTS